MMMHRYFISYSHGQGFGNLEFPCENEIKKIGDIQLISRRIERDLGFPPYSVVVLNFKKLN